MKYLTFLFLLLTAPIFAQEENVYRIKSTYEDGRSGYGTAFSYGDPRFIITAGHCVNKATSMEIKRQAEDPIKIKKAYRVLFSDDILKTSQDISILFLEQKIDTVQLKFRNDDAIAGEKIYTLGHPLSSDPQFRMDGSVISTKSINGVTIDSESFIFEPAPVGGQSGAPIFDSNGRVLGILVQSAAPSKNFGVAVSSKKVLLFLKENSK